MGGGKSSHSAAEEPLAAWGEPQSTSELLQRIQTSETFRRSDRLKELLAYLVHRSETRPDAAAREQDIGTEVYGRDPDYDTSHDTIVRVPVAQLRKKLERYYETEGAADGQILTIPRGRYQVHWAPRTPEPEPPPAVPESHETAVTG